MKKGGRGEGGLDVRERSEFAQYQTYQRFDSARLDVSLHICVMTSRPPRAPLTAVQGGFEQVGAPQSIYDVCVDKGRGWRPGRVRGFLRAYVAKHADVPKRRAFRYVGPPVAPVAAVLQRIHRQLPPAYPPDDWVPPPEPGFEGSIGTRSVEEQPWRPVCFSVPTYSKGSIRCAQLNTRIVSQFRLGWMTGVQAGDADGSMFITPKTDVELDEELRALKLCSLVDMRHELPDASGCSA